MYAVPAGTDLAAIDASVPLLDLGPIVDEAQLVADYGRHLVSLSRIGDDGSWPSDDGAVHGVVVGVSASTVLWTDEPEFTDLGYRPPADWASLVDQAASIAARGRTALCLELGDGASTLVDLVQAVVVRTGGPDLYDELIRRQQPMDHPVVVEALRRVGELVRNGSLAVGEGGNAGRVTDTAA